jgi:glutamate synthase (NADPH/NADH) large chain
MARPSTAGTAAAARLWAGRFRHCVIGLYDPAERARRLRRRLRRPHQGPEGALSIVEQGLKILENLDHRGAVGADKLMGDGAGILIQIPDEFYRAEMAAPRA